MDSEKRFPWLKEKIAGEILIFPAMLQENWNIQFSESSAFQDLPSDTGMHDPIQLIQKLLWKE